jgi:hypothetical protein
VLGSLKLSFTMAADGLIALSAVSVLLWVMGHSHESVTVLMPVDNGGAYVEAAIESIRRQTRQGFGRSLVIS